MLLRADDDGLDGGGAEGFVGFEAVDAFDEHVAAFASADLDRRGGVGFHFFGVEVFAVFRRDVDLVNVDGNGFEQGGSPFATCGEG